MCIKDDGNKLSNEIIVCLTVLISVDRAPKITNKWHKEMYYSKNKNIVNIH